MFKGKSKILITSCILGSIYAIFLLYICISSIMSSSNAGEAVGSSIAVAMLTPHVLMFVLGVIFSWVGLASNKNWANLTAAILYAVGGVLFLLYFIFSIPIIILAFIGYAKQKKINRLQNI